MDFEQMLKLMEMMRMFSETPAAETAKAAPDYESLKFYDSGIHSPGLKTLKAAIPYLDYDQQRTLGIMVKLIEIQRLMQMYGEQTPGEAMPDWQRRMLIAIRPHIADERRYMVDLLIKLMDIKRIIDRAR